MPGGSAQQEYERRRAARREHLRRSWRLVVVLIVVAFVVLQAGADVTEAALDAHCLAEIARFKRPKRYIFVSALPKNNYGKVLKTELRARLTST